MVVLVGGPGVLWEGAFEVEALAGSHVVEVLGHWAVGVALDEEVEVAACFWSCEYAEGEGLMGIGRVPSSLTGV